MIENEVFNKYVKDFKELSLDRKKSVTIEEMKKILAFIMLIKEKKGVPKTILYNREIVDANGSSVSEDDFVEAIFVYANIIKEAFAEYVDNTIIKKEDL